MLRNFLSLSGAEVAGKLAAFAAFTYLARVTGPEGLGLVEFVAAVLMCAGLMVEQGFGPYGAREIAKDRARTAELVWEIVLARFALAIVAYLGMIIFAVLTRRSPVATQMLLICGASLLVAPLTLQWVFQGHDRMSTVAATNFIRTLVFTVVVFAAVRVAADVWMAAVAELCAMCAAAAFSVWQYRRQFGPVVRGRLVFSKRLFREGVPIGLSQMFWVVRLSGATLILGLIAPAQDVGFFAGALRILMAVHTFVWLYYFNLLPSLARAWQQGAPTFAGLIDRSLRVVVVVSVVGAAVWVAVAPAMVTLVYGAAFAPAGTALQWMAAVCAVAAVSGHYRFGLIAAGRQTAEMATAALGAAVALPLIPMAYFSSGPAGAAAALLVTEVAVWGAAWWCARGMLTSVRPATAGAPTALPYAPPFEKGGPGGI